MPRYALSLSITLSTLVSFLARCDQSAIDPDNSAHAAPTPIQQEPVKSTFNPTPRRDRSEFLVLAQNLAPALALGLDEPEYQPPMPQLLAEINVKLANLESIRSSDSLTTKIVAQACESGTSMVQGLQTMQMMEQEDGFANLAIGALGLYLGEPTAVMGAAGGLLAQGETLKQEQSKFAAALQRFRAAQLMLPHAAKKGAGDRVSSDSIISLDFNESWAGTPGYDSLTFRNVSGQALNNSMILVELRGKDGQVCQNVHFVESWEDQGVRYAKYDQGLDAFGVCATIPHVQELRFSIWSDELSKENVSYKYAGQEQARDVGLMLERDLQLLWNFWERKPAYSFDSGEMGVYLTLEGVAKLPAHRITLRFHRAVLNSAPQKIVVYWDMKEWTAGDQRYFNVAKHVKDVRVGDAIDVEISFPGIQHVWKRTRVLQEGVKTPIRLGGSN